MLVHLMHACMLACFGFPRASCTRVMRVKAAATAAAAAAVTRMHACKRDTWHVFAAPLLDVPFDASTFAGQHGVEPLRRRQVARPEHA
jgi:uncharacterized protein YceK